MVALLSRSDTKNFWWFNFASTGKSNNSDSHNTTFKLKETMDSLIMNIFKLCLNKNLIWIIYEINFIGPYYTSSPSWNDSFSCRFIFIYAFTGTPYDYCFSHTNKISFYFETGCYKSHASSPNDIVDMFFCTFFNC